jgi:hypothetical protein
MARTQTEEAPDVSEHPDHQKDEEKDKDKPPKPDKPKPKPKPDDGRHYG